MVQKDLLNRSLDAGKEATAKAQSNLEGLLDDISKAAQDQADQAQQFAQDLLDRSQKSSEKLLKVIDREIRAQIGNLGLATKADIRRLEKKIEALQKGAPAKKAAKKSSTTKKSAKKSATSTAKKATRKASSTD